MSETLLPQAGSASVAVGRQVRDLQVLLNVSRLMAGTVDTSRLLEQILESARQVLSADRATLFLYDPNHHELYSRIAHGAGEIRFPADRGIAGAAASGRKTINIPDAYADPRFNRDVDRSTGYHTRCLLTVPLVGLDEQLVGVVQVLNKTTGSGVFDDYDVGLAEALAAQVGVALQRARLMDHYVEKKQLEQSLNIARTIQQGLLPKESPTIPGYDVAGWNRPADQTGGDAFDFCAMPGGRWAISVADASGHGIGPALVVSTTRALLRAVSESCQNVDDVLSRVNRRLCDDLTEGRFVTVFYSVLDPATHLLHFASAGHGPLFWYSAATGQVTDTGATGFPLGIVEPNEFTPTEPYRFAVGDVGVFLTDGFGEAADPAGELFGDERLMELIRLNVARPASELISILETAVTTHVAGGPQMDDLTAVVIRRVK